MTTPNTPAVEYPLTEAPRIGARFYGPNLGNPDHPHELAWRNSATDARLLASGLVYSTAAGAADRARAMIIQTAPPKPRRVYLAGPMTGLPDDNYPAFNAMALKLRASGAWIVENPAENPAPPCRSWAAYLRTALRQMLTCECVYLLPGWNDSKGALLEAYVAAHLGMDLLTDDGTARMQVVTIKEAGIQWTRKPVTQGTGSEAP